MLTLLIVGGLITCGVMLFSPKKKKWRGEVWIRLLFFFFAKFILTIMKGNCALIIKNMKGIKLMKRKGLVTIIGGGLVALAGIAGVILGIRKNKTADPEYLEDFEAKDVNEDPDYEVVNPDNEE